MNDKILKEVVDWAFQDIITKQQLYDKIKGLVIFGRVGEWQIEAILRQNSKVIEGHQIVVPEEMFTTVAKEIKELSEPDALK